MSVLICGSIAYDTIMVFPERFKDHILPDKMHILNVAFVVPEMRRDFGGVAGNISYNLKMLGGDPYPMMVVVDTGAGVSVMGQQQVEDMRLLVDEGGAVPLVALGG